MEGYGLVNEIERNGIVYQCWRSITDPKDEQIVTIETTEKLVGKKGKQRKIKERKQSKAKARIKAEWGRLWRS